MTLRYGILKYMTLFRKYFHYYYDRMISHINFVYSQDADQVDELTNLLLENLNATADPNFFGMHLCFFYSEGSTFSLHLYSTMYTIV